MEYSIKEVVQNVDISEQGLYKRIKTNYDDYLKKGYIITKLIAKPGGAKSQTFITESGLNDLLKTRPLKEGSKLNQVAKTNTTKLSNNTKPQKEQNSTEVAQSLTFEVLNQSLVDLKEENKRLNAKIDKQEEFYNKKMDEQKKEFQEAYKNQQEIYQKMIDKMLNNFNNAIQRLPEPPQNQEQPSSNVIVEEAETEPRGIKKLFSKFKKIWV